MTTFTIDNWKKVLYSVFLAVDYLHTKSILHNDIVRTGVDVSSVLIDLGKGCFIKNRKLCSIISEKKQQDHILKYPQLAQDLICCHCTLLKLGSYFNSPCVIVAFGKGCYCN